MRTIALNPLVWVIIAVLLFGCSNFENENNYRDAYTWPTTKKEYQYQKLLEGRGFSEISFGIPIPSRGQKGFGQYSLFIQSALVITPKNYDSIGTTGYNIANELYKNIIADSILFDINRIHVKIIGEQKPKAKECWDGFYEKYQLEHWNGFKVIQKSKGSYTRVPVSNDSL